ncbi:MAG: branched-chain amino acid ABC transporter permease, partial [Acidimicrobiales bacterium]
MARTARRTLWAPSLLAYLVCMFLLAHSSPYHQGLLLVAAAYAMLALSLDLVAGSAGLYSLGHAGLFAIGAYGTAVLAEREHWSVFAALPVVVVAGAIVGLLIGALSLRVSGLYFAITTLIFTIIVTVLVSNMTITGGYQGLSSPTFPSFSRSVTSALGSSLTWAVSGCLLLAIVVVWSIRSSAMYPVLLAIRDSERFASSAGVRTSATKILLFGLSAAIAGLAGWAFCFLGFITPSQFDTTASINVLVMVIIGGMNTRLGPIVGAVFVGLFPVVVSINSLWQEVIYGAVFIAVIVFLPEGFVGVVSRGGRLLVSMWPRIRGPG